MCFATPLWHVLKTENSLVCLTVEDGGEDSLPEDVNLPEDVTTQPCVLSDGLNAG